MYDTERENERERERADMKTQGGEYDFDLMSRSKDSIECRAIPGKWKCSLFSVPCDE